MIGFILFSAFFVLILLGVPIGISLGFSTVIAILFMPGLNLDFFVRGLISGLDSFPLIAVLFFTIAGNIMGRGGISARLLRLANIFFGHIRGSLGIVTIVACMMFAAISGTGSATVAAIGSIMIPAMIKQGYNKNFAGSLVASAGTIGAIIPPSVSMIVYAVASGVSVTSMFLAGIGPGILIGVFLIIFCYIYSCKNSYQKDSHLVQTEHNTKTQIQETTIRKDETILHSVWAVSVPVMILGGIYGGVFTPTEAAGVAVVYGTVISIYIYKELKWSDLPAIFLESTLLVSCVLVILGASVGFGRVLTLERVPVSIANFITSITDNKIVILLLINILLLIIGTFMETLAAIVILTPILLPIVQKIGVDPTHFGIIMIVNLCIGFITPPLGANLFMTAQVGKLQFDELAKSILIWVLIMIAALMFITYIPSISLGLETLLS